MQRVHRDLTVCDVRPRPVHTFVLEASPLRSIASICPGGFARHYNRARGTRFPEQPSAVPILHRCHIPNAMPATGTSVAVRLCSCSGQNATTGSVPALVCSSSAQRHLWC